jgi:hypothetical protein
MGAGRYRMTPSFARQAISASATESAICAWIGVPERARHCGPRGAPRVPQGGMVPAFGDTQHPQSFGTFGELERRHTLKR